MFRDSPAAFMAAKFNRTDTSAGYHPLICHMLDVAAVARALWDGGMSRFTEYMIEEASIWAN